VRPCTGAANAKELSFDDLDSTTGQEFEPILRDLRRDLITVETAELTRLYNDGTIGAATRRDLQRRLDLEDTSLDH